MSERMELIEMGRWSAVWGQVQQAKEHDKDTRSEIESRVLKVEALLEAGEVSRAAQAAGGGRQRQATAGGGGQRQAAAGGGRRRRVT